MPAAKKAVRQLIAAVVQFGIGQAQATVAFNVGLARR